MEDYIRTWLPIGISLFALLVTATFSWSAHADRRTSARLAREKDLHAWVREVSEIFVTLNVGDAHERKKACAQLSLNNDYGRLFFPNERTMRALREYQKGRRSGILDPLVEASKRCANDEWDTKKLGADWREFVDQLCLLTTAFAIDTSPEAVGRIQYRNS